MRESYLWDVNFPMDPKNYGLEGKLTRADIISIRSRYLERVYGSIARHSRNVLTSQAKVITQEMIDAVLLEKRDFWK